MEVDMGNVFKLIGVVNTGIGIFGPKAAAIGVLLVIAGQALQGHWDQIDAHTAEAALIALGLWGARANQRTSEDVGAK
jgi:hypothetical protein